MYSKVNAFMGVYWEFKGGMKRRVQHQWIKKMNINITSQLRIHDVTESNTVLSDWNRIG